jgi:ribosomal protein S12 methylthiotransferase
MKEQLTFSLVSLGCPKALVDSEIILGMMVSSGYLLREELVQSDIVIVNTCCFIRDATYESMQAVADVLRLKSKGDVKRVVVYGCMAERWGEGLVSRLPGIDAVVGLASRDELPEVCRQLATSADSPSVLPSGSVFRTDENRVRLRITPRHYAYLKISEGCSNRCSYCVIPTIRGSLRSRTIDSIVAEANDLTNDGVVELNLVAQDTAAFGLDRNANSELPVLLEKLCQIENLEWIRVLYAHPVHMADEIARSIAQFEKVVKYIDMPVQHASDRILGKMYRKTEKEGLMRLVSLMREKIKDLVIRTTLLVGFPGESEDDFEELLGFVRAVRFDRLGAFKYSPEQGTAAFSMPEQIPDEVKAERYDRLMKTQQEIAFEKNRQLIGKKTKVIVDDQSDRSDHPWVGRTYGDAPDIDNKVFFVEESLKPGSIFSARVLEADGYDLIVQRAAGR